MMEIPSDTEVTTWTYKTILVHVDDGVHSAARVGAAGGHRARAAAAT